MVNPLDFIPKLSGFSPMPLGIMAPFMGYQSAALAYNFGLNYEFGKRVIKSMSNEKFNKIADDPILLNELTSRHHDVLLKAFINEVPKVDKIQDLIIKKMVELEFAKIKIMPELIAQIPKGFIEGIFALGGGGSPEDIQRPPPQGPPKRPPREPAKPILPKKPIEPKERRMEKKKVLNLSTWMPFVNPITIKYINNLSSLAQQILYATQQRDNWLKILKTASDKQTSNKSSPKQFALQTVGRFNQIIAKLKE